MLAAISQAYVSDLIHFHSIELPTAHARSDSITAKYKLRQAIEDGEVGLLVVFIGLLLHVRQKRPMWNQ